MTRYVFGVLLLCGLGFWGYLSWQSQVESTQERERQATRIQAIKTSVSDMVIKANAVTNWAELLVGDNKRRNSPILTVELQKLWLTGRPILVIGNIEDIALNSDGTYQVIVEHEDRYGSLWNEIRVSLKCDAAVAVPLVQAIKSKKKTQRGADTAITGLIEYVIAKPESDAEGSANKILTGVGRCIDAIPLAERIS